MLKKILRGTVVSCLLLVLVSPAWAVTLRMDSPYVILRLKPGEKASGVIGLVNPTESATNVNMYTEDWTYKEIGTGEKIFLPPGANADSASEWISVNTQEMVLPPFGRGEISYTVEVPREGVEGTYRSVLFFETAAGEAQDPEGNIILVQARLGSLFRIEIEGTLRHQGLVKSIEVKPPQGSKPAVFDITFQNTGNVDIELKGNFMILDEAGVAKGRGELESIFTYKGMAASRATEWAGSLAPGQYTVVFTFDLGEGEISSEGRSMVVP